MTEQIPEHIIIQNNVYPFTFGILNDLMKFLPDPFPGIERVRPKWDSTGCYRGYEGTWKFENNELFLVGIKPTGKYNKVIDEPIFASWVSGIIECRGFSIQVEEGLVVQIRYSDLPHVELTQDFLKEKFG